MVGCFSLVDIGIFGFVFNILVVKLVYEFFMLDFYFYLIFVIFIKICIFWIIKIIYNIRVNIFNVLKFWGV